jgi:hypothetical protein
MIDEFSLFKKIIWIFIVLYYGTGDWTQGLMNDRQKPNHSATFPALDEFSWSTQMQGSSINTWKLNLKEY